jgi:hypothetical protein
MTRWSEQTNYFSAPYDWLSILSNTRGASPTASANVEHGSLDERGGAGTGGPVLDRRGRRVGRRAEHAQRSCLLGRRRAATNIWWPGKFRRTAQGFFGKLRNMEGGFNCEVSIHGWIGIRRRKGHDCTQRLIAY